ncbi:hypothetical protein [Teredinibacter haidensis]|uniref:hypothetical protein n=1 Tax=Teredinibacter haidensis TaxID=2731755 RepID=UPI0009488FB0|nr:hypothetical protein [Teredinibacter haidensis]
MTDKPETTDNVVPLKKKTPAEEHKGKSMCRHGFHKWIIKQDKQFDVKQGKLVTILKCSRCGKEKVQLS